MPLFVKKFLVDFVETAIGAVLALNIVFPNSIADAKQVAAVVGLAILAAAVSAVRRAAPSFVAWLSGKLGVTTGS